MMLRLCMLLCSDNVGHGSLENFILYHPPYCSFFIYQSVNFLNILKTKFYYLICLDRGRLDESKLFRIFYILK